MTTPKHFPNIFKKNEQFEAQLIKEKLELMKNIDNSDIRRDDVHDDNEKLCCQDIDASQKIQKQQEQEKKKLDMN